MLCCVALVRTDISEECIASIIRVLVSADAVPNLLILVTLIMEVILIFLTEEHIQISSFNTKSRTGRRTGNIKLLTEDDVS
jgi:hypothetical protein